MATKTKICPECGTVFEPARQRGKPQVFCSTAHKEAHAMRRAVRGKKLVALAQAWRKTRNVTKASPNYDFATFLFREVTSLIDDWNAEDAEAGRMDPVEYAKLVTKFETVNPNYYGGKTFVADRWMDRRNHR